MKKEIPKYGTQEIIQFIGLKELSLEEQELLKEITERESAKIKRQINNLTSLIVQVKKYAKSGSKPKYAFHIRLIAPTKTIESCKAHDWDFARALRKALHDLSCQIEHTFKTDPTRPTFSRKNLQKRKREFNIGGYDS